MIDEWKVLIPRLTHLIDKAEKFFSQHEAINLEDETNLILGQYSTFRWQIWPTRATPATRCLLR